MGESTFSMLFPSLKKKKNYFWMRIRCVCMCVCNRSKTCSGQFFVGLSPTTYLHRMLVNNVKCGFFQNSIRYCVYTYMYMPYHIFTSVCKFRFFSCLIKLNLELVHGCVARIWIVFLRSFSYHIPHTSLDQCTWYPNKNIYSMLHHHRAAHSGRWDRVCSRPVCVCKKRILLNKSFRHTAGHRCISTIFLL